jgi:predicted nucleic acid-binding Zn ribbon protein
MYATGATLRQVGAQFHITPEGIRQVLLRAGVDVRSRAQAGELQRANNPPEARFCPICGKPVLHKTSRTCSVDCAAKYRTKGPPQWIQEAIEKLKQGASFSEAAGGERGTDPWILSRWVDRLGVKIPPWKLTCKDCGEVFEYKRTRRNKPLYCTKCRKKDRRKFEPAMHFATDDRRVGCKVTHRKNRKLVKTSDPTLVTCERCLQSDIYHEATASTPETAAPKAPTQAQA